MISQNFATSLKDVSEEQRDIFLDFHKKHPYSTVIVQNKVLKYISGGDGEKALVFLHGALVEPDMWFYPIMTLEKKFRIIAPFFSHQMMGAQDAADFIHAILKQENITKATFVGMSYGGGVAQYLAEKHPELIDKLVLTHTGIVGRKGAAEQIEKTRKIVRLFPFFLMKRKLKDRIENVPASEWNEFHKAYFLETIARLTKPLFLAYLESMIRFDNETRDFPTDTRQWQGETILLGTRNDKDAFKHFDKLLKLYPHAKSTIFEEEGGHHMSFLFPEKYTQVLSHYLEYGDSIVSMKSDADYRGQLLLRQNAFAGKAALSEEEIEHITKISSHARDNPIYHAETDLCVVAPDGTYVSGCEALIDTRNLEADIERVCTHSNFRRQGLARVVIQECLYRLQEMGVKKAHITGYSEGAIALYNSLGSRKRTEFFIYNQKR